MAVAEGCLSYYYRYAYYFKTGGRWEQKPWRLINLLINKSSTLIKPRWLEHNASNVQVVVSVFSGNFNVFLLSGGQQEPTPPTSHRRSVAEINCYTHLRSQISSYLSSCDLNSDISTQHLSQPTQLMGLQITFNFCYNCWAFLLFLEIFQTSR